MLEMMGVEYLAEFNELKNDCRMAEAVTNLHQNQVLPKYHAQQAAAQKWLNDNPNPSTMFERLQAKVYTVKVEGAAIELESINKRYESLMATAQERDKQCILDRAKK